MTNQGVTVFIKSLVGSVNKNKIDTVNEKWSEKIKKTKSQESELPSE